MACPTIGSQAQSNGTPPVDSTGDRKSSEQTSSASAEKALAQAEQLRNSGEGSKIRESVPVYETAVTLFRAAAHQKGEAEAFTGLGRAQDALGEKTKALESFEQARTLQHLLNDPGGEAFTLGLMAVIYDHTVDRKKALELLELALPLAQQANDPHIEGVILNNFGLVYYDLGDLQKALDYYNRALPFHQAAGNLRGQGMTLGNIGMIYDSLGEKTKALEYLNQALPLRRAAGTHSEVAWLLGQFGYVYVSMGEYVKALDYLNQSLSESKVAGDGMGELIAIHNIASVDQRLGEYQKALDNLNRAFSLEKEIKYEPGQPNTLHNIGGVYRDLGEVEQALDYYDQALSLYESLAQRGLANPTGQAATLNDIGNVHFHLGAEAGDGKQKQEQFQKALELEEQALALERAAGHSSVEAATLNSMGRIHSALGETQKALELYNQALALNRSRADHSGEALTLFNIAMVYAGSGEQDKALEFLQQDLAISRALREPKGEASALYEIARAQRSLGNLEQARSSIDAALKIAESLRSNVGGQELRTSYFASVQDYYALSIDVLMLMHKKNPDEETAATALEQSERQRARSLMELLVESGADIRQGVDSSLLEHERSLEQILRAKADLYTRLMNSKHTDAQASAAAGEIDALSKDLDAVESQIRTTSPAYSALLQPQPLDIKAIQRDVLDADTLLLEYALGDERSYLLVVSAGDVKGYELPKRTEIAAAALHFYELVKANGPDAQVAEAANTVSKLILAPAAAELKSKRLLIVADGILNYLPFAALADPSMAAYQPLISQHEVSAIPSASTLALLRQQTAARKPVDKSVAVLADPVFKEDDPRITGSVNRASKPANTGSTEIAKTEGPQKDLTRSARESGWSDATSGFGRLLETRSEAKSILRLVPPDQAKGAFDFDASKATAISPDLANYRIVHFATHALLNNVHPELSGIVLSLVKQDGTPQDGLLRLDEIYNLKLPAELVVLSACQTGLGKNIRGEGLVGLTRGFMYAGAPRVVVSLWKVDDKATSELMKRFYEGMLGKHLPAAAALRAAQIAMLKDKRWQSPYDWASFVLQGEWR